MCNLYLLTKPHHEVVHLFRSAPSPRPEAKLAKGLREKGAKTRTWFTLPGRQVFAVAGLWRDTPEWGPAYTMVMTEACQHVAGSEPKASWPEATSTTACR